MTLTDAGENACWLLLVCSIGLVFLTASRRERIPHEPLADYQARMARQRAGDDAANDVATALCAVEWLARNGETGPALHAVLEDLDAARERLRTARAAQGGARD